MHTPTHTHTSEHTLTYTHKHTHDHRGYMRLQRNSGTLCSTSCMSAFPIAAVQGFSVTNADGCAASQLASYPKKGGRFSSITVDGFAALCLSS